MLVASCELIDRFDIVLLHMTSAVGDICYANTQSENGLLFYSVPLKLALEMLYCTLNMADMTSYL